MQFATHPALQRGIDELMLAHTRQACEGRGHNAGTIVIAVAGQIVDDDLGVGKGLGQMAAKRIDGHGHGSAVSRVGGEDGA
jgi:hypothetical protein